MRWMLWLLVCAPAWGEPCKLVGKPWLTANKVDALRGETIEIRLNARLKQGGKATVWQHCPDLQVTWRRIEPEMEHVDTPSPNKDISVYANAVVFGPSHGSWIGFDKIEYFSTELDEHGPILTVKDARPSDEALAEKRTPELRELGVMRVAATILGQTTPPLRYTYRSGNDFLGWLSSFYNVPYLFGSAGKGKKNQAEQYIGADCADILVAALRRAGWTKMEYSSVADLVDSLHPIGKPVEIQPGQPSQLRWGRDVKPGDLLALDYIGADGDLPRDWDHIVAAIADSGPGGLPDGVLGPEDLVVDSGSAEGLKQAPLGEQGHVRVAVLRPPQKPPLARRSD
jgi:hypothetical protein